MKFNIGDKISFLDAVGSATIKAISGDQVLVEDENGFHNWFNKNEIIKSQTIEVSSVSIKDGPSKPMAKKSSIKERGIQEKDLHIHLLVENTRGMTNYDMLKIQLEEAEKALKKARKAKAIKLIFIHGVGEGKLRYELHNWLTGVDGISFYDASFLKYGAGATEVDLW